MRKENINSMQLNKGDIIIDGDDCFFVHCVMWSVIYVKRALDVKPTPCYELDEVLKHYRKIEIMGDDK